MDEYAAEVEANGPQPSRSRRGVVATPRRKTTKATPKKKPTSASTRRRLSIANDDDSDPGSEGVSTRIRGRAEPPLKIRKVPSKRKP